MTTPTNPDEVKVTQAPERGAVTAFLVEADHHLREAERYRDFRHGEPTQTEKLLSTAMNFINRLDNTRQASQPLEPQASPNVEEGVLATADRLARRMGGRFVPHQKSDALPMSEPQGEAELSGSDAIALDGYRAAASYIGADSWDGCSDCMEILKAAKATDMFYNPTPDDTAHALKQLRSRYWGEHAAHPQPQAGGEELVERVARAISREVNSWDKDGDQWEGYADEARAALAAMSQPTDED